MTLFFALLDHYIILIQIGGISELLFAADRTNVALRCDRVKHVRHCGPSSLRRAISNTSPLASTAKNTARSPKSSPLRI